MNCIGEILKQLTFCRRLDYEIAYCFESLFELVVNGFVVRVHELYGGIDNLWSNPLNWTKVPLPIVQKQVGHRSLKTTSVYLSLSTEKMAQAYKTVRSSENVRTTAVFSAD